MAESTQDQLDDIGRRLARIDTRLASGFDQINVATEVESPPDYKREHTIEDLWNRVARIETRLVEGFCQLGVDPRVKKKEVPVLLDMQTNRVCVPFLGLTLDSIINKLKAVSAPAGAYSIVCNDSVVAELSYGG